MPYPEYESGSARDSSGMGIFYSVFDNTVGPQIVSQVPAHEISETLFEQISNYVFPKRELLGSIVSVTTNGVQIMSCSYSLESPKYLRHRFSFAFGMVFSQDEDSGPYQPVLHKMAKTFSKLEQESGFLSAVKGKMGAILERVRDDLVVRGECQVNLQSATLALKLLPKLLDAPPISDYKVPVFIRDLRALMTRDWDLTIQKLEPFIDGRNFVKRIAHLTNVDLSLVRQCIGQLLYYRAIAIVDVFQYSNLYVCTNRLAVLCSDERMQKECLRAIVSGAARQPPHISKVIHLYASLHPCAPFGEFCIEHDTERLGIDDVALVTFGVRFDIIRRVQCVPVPVNPALASKSPESFDTQAAGVKRLIDGMHTFDEICGETTMSAGEVNLLCESLGESVVIVKR